MGNKSGAKSHSKGKKAENAVTSIISHTFLKDFVYENPILKSGKEISDVVVMFYDTLLLIEVKSHILKDSIDREKDLKKYIRKTVVKATKQINVAYNRIMKKDTPTIAFSNERRGNLEFNPSEIKNVHCLIVLEEDIPVANYRLTLDFYPELRDVKIKPDIINLEDLRFLIQILDTPIDFLEYIVERRKIILSEKPILYNEMELFGFYLSNNKNMQELLNHNQDIIAFNGFAHSIIEGELKLLLDKKKILDEPSYLIDKILDVAHSADDVVYQDIFRELAHLDRVSRRILGRAAFNKSIETSLNVNMAEGYISMRNPRNIDDDIRFIFYFGKKSREEISKNLHMVCTTAQYSTSTKRILGVGTTPPGFQNTNYFEFIFIDGFIYEDIQKLGELDFNNFVQLTNSLWNKNPNPEGIPEFEYGP